MFVNKKTFLICSDGDVITIANELLIRGNGLMIDKRIFMYYYGLALNDRVLFSYKCVQI